MPNFEIATVGDNCIDRYASPINLTTVGGNAVNVAVQLRRLGHKVGYFGAVGADDAGKRILACLHQTGVATDHVRVVAGETASTEIGSDPSGERSILAEEFGVCRGYRPDRDEIDILRSMRHVHIGWLDDRGILKRTLARSGGSVSQDLSVNADPESVGARDLAVAFASVGPSREMGSTRLRELLDSGARTAVVTCGALGSMAGNGTSQVFADAAPSEVVDTLGAGDTFIAAFLAAHLNGADLRSCLLAGRNEAARTCSHYGGFPQTPEPLRAS